MFSSISVLSILSDRELGELVEVLQFEARTVTGRKCWVDDHTPLTDRICREIEQVDAVIEERHWSSVS